MPPAGVSSWRGITVDGRIEGGFLTLRQGGLTLAADFGDLEGIHMESASGPLTIGATGNLTGLAFQSA